MIFDPGTVNLNLTIEKESDGEPSSPGSGGSSLQKPNAKINAPSYGFVNESTIINASGSYDSDGKIISYSWTFGDGSSGSGYEVNHTYKTFGVYQITLLVEDDDKLTDTDELSINIMNDSDKDKWGDIEEELYDTDPENGSDYPSDFDGDHIPDSIDLDDDNDGLSDDLENMLGSNYHNKNDIIDLSNLIEYGFLIDTNEDGIFDIFYNAKQFAC